jgi:pimeloyl-ACP methyl ester carboxylesterase
MPPERSDGPSPSSDPPRVDAPGSGSGSDQVATPLESLDVLAVQEKSVAEGLDHVELYAMSGLLTLLWHGPRDASHVVLMGGGAMGGLLGPADGLYHDLGTAFSALGIGSIRVGYRRPNDLERCVVDMVAAAELAVRVGASRFVTVGHSFGGAVALNAGIALGTHTAGVVTLSTQSAGCEQADLLGDTPLLLLHGTADELLPPMASEMVRMIAGTGELVLLPGAGHLLAEAGTELRDRLGTWIPDRFAEP